MRISRLPLKWLFAVLLIPMLCAGGYRIALLLNGNFHEVVAGELYRSARPTASALTDYQRQYGIRTVLNLRGSNPEKRWYREEAERTKELGITLIDIPLNSKHALTDKEMQHLITTMREAPKPLLIHCQAGADRTSLATALYLYAIKHQRADVADEQLSLWFGHLPFSFSKAYAMDRSFIAYSQLHPNATKLAENRAATPAH